MKARSPQLRLRLDAAAPDRADRWRDGAGLLYLGSTLILKLDTDRGTAVREDDALHLPLPPGASPRQIQDGAEAWLRQEASRLIGASIARQTLGNPRWALSFAARGGPAQVAADGVLRFNWRLIEQPAALIEQVVGRALAALPQPAAHGDLWGLLPT